MKFEEVVEAYTGYLFNLTYLYVNDRQKAQDIVQDVFARYYKKHGKNFNMEQVKASLEQMTVKHCKDYFRSWKYQKVKMKDFLFTPREKFELSDGDQDYAKVIMRLPLRYREVVILYSYVDKVTPEIAKLLHIPIDTVKIRLQEARLLMKGILIEEGMTRRIDESLRNLEYLVEPLKQKIYEVVQKQPTKINRKPWYYLATVALIAIGASVFVLWPQPGTPTEVSKDETIPTESKVIPSEDNYSGEYRIPDEKTFAIAKYESFYNSNSMYSEKEAHIFAFFTVIDWYATFYYLEKFNVFLEEDKESTYRTNMALQLRFLKQNKNFVTYFAQLQKDLGISEEDYIEYLLLQHEDQVMKDRIYEEEIGLDMNGMYPVEENFYEYAQILGYSKADINKMGQEIEQVQDVETGNVPNLPFDATGLESYNITVNEQGEPIFGKTAYFYLYETNYMETIYQLENNKYLENLTRSNLDDYIKYLEEYEANQPEIQQSVKEIHAIYTMLKRSIEWEYDFSKTFLKIE